MNVVNWQITAIVDSFDTTRCQVQRFVVNNRQQSETTITTAKYQLNIRNIVNNNFFVKKKRSSFAYMYRLQNID